MGYGFHRNRKPNLSLLRISVYMLKNIETDKFKNILRACIYANICYMNYHIPQQNKCHHVKQLRTTYLHYYHYLSFKLTPRFFLSVFFHCHAKKKHLRPAAVVHRCHFQWLEGRREAVPNPPPPRLWLPSLASQRFSPRPFKEIKETTGKAGNMKNLNSKHNKWKGWFGNMITLFLFKWSLKHWNSRMKFCSWLATYCQDATALNNMQQARLTHASKTRKLEVGCVW